MPERTDWDDTVDAAIERLISDDTEAFSLVAVQDDDVHLVKANDRMEDLLLAVYMLVREVQDWGAQAGEEFPPEDIISAAALVAREEYGLDGGA